MKNKKIEAKLQITVFKMVCVKLFFHAQSIFMAVSLCLLSSE